MPVTPFVIGQWVRGKKFYGREALIEEILHGNRNWLWLLGTRRIGKTSLLKQIEHLTSSAEDSPYFPLFWDFQGADDPKELHLGFTDSLLDAEERLDQRGISLDQVETDDLFTSLSRLRRKLRSKKLKLLLLCDEVEELIKLNRKDPSLLRKLRRAMQSQEDIRSVLASTIRLWALSDERGDTSPFLHGFSPPLYIHNLDDEEARALIRQVNLPTDSRTRFDDQAVELIRGHCDNHPYLVQLLCKRCLELDDLDEAIEQVAADPMVSFFFSVDFEMLSETERDIIRVIGEQDSSTSNSIQVRISVETPTLSASLHRLEHLGYIRRNQDHRFILVNYFFSRWFREMPSSADSRPTPVDQQPTIQIDEAASTETDPLRARVLDGRYELQQRVGAGATGIVFKAYDTMLRTHIAVKMLKSEYAANDEALERLRRETLLSRDLAHPSIVRLYHLGESDGTKYLTMQWMGGPTLAKVIAEEAPFDDRRTIGIAVKLAGALEAAHACQVLHRDIKPQNILLDDQGQPYLTDFGLARLLGGPGMTSQGVFLGTPYYASPEQANLQPLDERSDLYALGLVLFEMALGRRPFVAPSTSEILAMQRTAAPPVPREVRADMSKVLSDLILRCLEKEPARRFQTARELRAALEAL